MSHKKSVRRVLSPLIAAALSGAALGFLHTSGKLFISDLLEQLLWIVPIYLLLAFHVDKDEHQRRDPAGVSTGSIIFFVAVLTLFSSLSKHNWFYFLEWAPWPDADVLAPGVAQFVFITAIGIPLMLRGAKYKNLALLIALLFIETLAISQLLKVTGGGPVYRDDHPSFMFRLWEFSHTFPQLINFNPYWNGGVVGHHGTASGVSILGIPLFPLLKLWEPHVLYTFILILVYIIAIPWITVGSMRIMGANKSAALIAGILALGVSRQFFLWMLHYGTIGANFAIPFIIPVSACLYRIVITGKTEKWVGVILVISMFMMLAWPLAAVPVLGLLLAGLLNIGRLKVRSFTFLLICAVAFALLYSKLLIIIFTESRTFEKHVAGVLASPDSKEHFVLTADILLKGWTHVWAHLREAHPLIVFLGLIGVWFYPNRNVRYWFGPIIIVMFIITGWGKYYFPDLQLRRMSIPLCFVAVPPAALWCSRLLSTRSRKTVLVRAAMFAFLLVGGLSVTKVYGNKGHAPYQIVQPYLKSLMSFLEDHVPEDGRALFAGSTIHKYGRAHVAAFPLFLKKEMMACDYYAFSPKEVEYEYPPREFRKRDNGTWKFMELYNVTHIITYKSNWIRYLDKRSAKYERVFSLEEKNIHVYRVKRQPDIFLRGSGSIDAHFNRIQITPDPDQEDLVVKYNWSDGFTVDAPAEIYPYEADEHATLIGVRPNGVSDVTLRFKSSL